MLRFIISAALFIHITGCKSQIQNNSNVKNDTMEFFNIRNFQENQIGNEYNFTLEDGTKIRQIDFGNYYAEDIKYTDSPYEIRKAYYKNNGFLWVKGKKFYGFEIGIWREYNPAGELTKETDYNKPYKFSVEDLIKKMKDEYHIDILHNSLHIYISRYTNELGAKYDVCIHLKENKYSDMKCFIIDGTTGKTISENIVRAETEKN